MPAPAFLCPRRLMRILFIHNNFPGRLGALARTLAASGHEVLFAASHGRRGASLAGVQRTLLKIRVKPRAGGNGAVQAWENALSVGGRAIAPLRVLAGDFHPDMVLSTHAEGLAFFARHAFPQAFHVFYLDLAPAPPDIAALRALQSDFCVAFSEAARLALPKTLHSRVRIMPPWLDPELDPAGAEAFLPEILEKGAELVSVDMTGLTEDQEGDTRRLALEFLALRPRCHAVLDYGENSTDVLWARRLPADLHRRLHVASFLPLAARRDLLCASSIFLCPAKTTGLFPGRLDAMACGALILSPVPEGVPLLRPGENMLLFPEGSHRKRLSTLIAALDHARDFAPVRARARQCALESFAPETVLPAHAAMLMQAFPGRGA